MARIDLLVPFSEKDAAKQLGAKWDVAKKVWYVPDGINPSAFRKWLPQTIEEILQERNMPAGIIFKINRQKRINCAH